MRLNYRFLLAGILLCFGSSAFGASVPGHLQFSADASGDEYEIADPGQNGLVTVFVVAKGFDGVAGFHFSAPIPPSSGLIYLADQSAFFPSGNSQNGIDVALGSCKSGSFVVVQMLFFRTNQGDACTLYGAEPGAFYTDCIFTESPVQVADAMLNSDGACSRARNLTPADGAVNVPLVTSLTWTPGYTPYLYGAQLYFGTSPSPPEVASYPESPFSVGPLQPGTKYYWQVADPGAGPVWSFTTTIDVATKPSTWGAIKALYR